MHRDKGYKVFNKIIKELSELAKMDMEPKMEGKQIIMVLSANKVE